MTDVWVEGDAYERFMGRWSRLLALMFVDWLDQPAGLRWTDVGCGTGALSAHVLARADPSSLLGIEPSPGFVATAAETLTDERAEFRQGSIELLEPGSADVVVSGLVLNFLPDAEAALTAFRRACPDGTVAAYVWDYAEKHPMLSWFWEVAERLDDAATGQSEVSRFELCHPDALTGLWRRAGLVDVRTAPLEIDMRYSSFADYWEPFLGGQGPAPAYVAGLGGAERERLRAALEQELGPGPFRLAARAWAVRGTSAS